MQFFKIFLVFFIALSKLNASLQKMDSPTHPPKDRKAFLAWTREEQWKRYIDRERCKLKSQRRACKKDARNDQTSQYETLNAKSS